MPRRSRTNPDGLTIFDSHCHLTDTQFAGDLSPTVRRGWSAGVKLVLTASQSVPDSKQTVDVARQYEHVYCAIGVHPHEADTFRSVDIQQLKNMCIEAKVRAIGEIGLDFFRSISSKANQETAFHAQIDLAEMLDLPTVIHVRDAAARVRDVMDEHGYYNGVLHCFSADRKLAEWAIERRLYVSFAGNVTYGDEKLAAVVRMIPAELLLVETDSPYLAPVPHRGGRNEPALIRLTIAALAGILGTDSRALAASTCANAKRLFRI
jgi:TatD DNase family protein